MLLWAFTAAALAKPLTASVVPAQVEAAPTQAAARRGMLRYRVADRLVPRLQQHAAIADHLENPP